MVGARVIAGFSAAAGEALGAAISADLFFVHERGWWLGMYMALSISGSAIGSILTGFIVEAGWRWHFWVHTHLVKSNSGWRNHEWPQRDCDLLSFPGDALFTEPEG